MALREFAELQKIVPQIDKKSMYYKICINAKKYRIEKYNEFKSQNTQTTINPYSSENVAALLDYNHTHYKRFESESDSTKQIPLDKIVKLSIILDKTLDDFLK